MISLAPLISPSFALDKEIPNSLQAALAEFRGLVAPLLEEESPRRLRTRLAGLCLEYAILNFRMWRLLRDDEKNLLVQIQDGLAQVTRLAERDEKRLLTSRARRALLGAVESLRSCLISAREYGDLEFTFPFMQSVSSLQKASLSISVVLMGLDGEIPAAKPKSLSLLCYAADHYVEEVEDIFLAFKAYVNGDSTKGGATIPLDEVRLKYGLQR